MQQSAAVRRTGLILAALAFLLAAAALAVSLYAWWSSTRSVEYTAEQQSAARDSACAAYTTVRTGVQTNTNLAVAGDDVGGALAVAANSRVALMSGGQYVLDRVDPATPAELAEPLRRFGNTLLDVGAAATAGALNTDPAQAELLREVDELNGQLTALCG
ncbi:hypothetical protein [Mycobacterium sp. MS1601]|uniref:hypothetical protein n=1 Tax=Mycobacterium sp. MS1601 TaxID=1936029 RepID=UPI00178C930F|nr:hypothetical protein [Mycobacterium sp. MS1601]